MHLEAWPIQALAETLDPDLKIANGPHPERDLRAALEAHPDRAVRARGLDALDRLDAARDALDAAPAESLRDALAALDAVFVELTGREPVRNQGRAYGARTLAYVDCMRDLDVTVGPQLVEELTPALQVMFEAGRWYCGQVNEIGRRVIEQALPGGRGPFMPVLIEVLRTLMMLPPEIAAERAELQRRLAAVLAAIPTRRPPARAPRTPSRTTGRRGARASFTPLTCRSPPRARRRWPPASTSRSSATCIRATTRCCRACSCIAIATRPPSCTPMPPRRAGVPYLLPPWAPGIGVDARGAALTPLDSINIAAMPDVRAQGGRHTWLPHELLVDGGDLVHPSGELRVPLA